MSELLIDLSLHREEMNLYLKEVLGKGIVSFGIEGLGGNNDFLQLNPDDVQQAALYLQK